MHRDNLLHGVGFGELDVVEKAAAQKGVRQLFFIVRGDEYQRPRLGAHQLAGFVAIKLHAVEFTQQVIGKLDVRFIDFIDQQGHWLFSGECLPQNAFDDVVVDVFDPLIAQLAVAQTADRVIFIQALLGFGGGLDVPLQQLHAQSFGHFFGQHGFARARLALDQQGAFQGDGSVDRQFEVLGGDVFVGALEFHDFLFRKMRCL